MMVEIRKGSKTLTIPAGAIRRYASAGWALATSSEQKLEESIQENAPFTDKTDEIETYSDTEESVEEPEIEEEYIEVDPEELAQRPLNTLDREEISILAEYKGIDTAGMTAKQIRAALRGLE